MYRFQSIQLICLLAVAALLSGCITTTPTPSYARSGDLVQVGLGGIKRNSSGQTLTAGDISATITDANSTVHDVTVRGLFRAFPDYTSWYSRDSLDRNDGYFGNVEPYDGMWWATLQLIDPAIGTPTPLPLAVGPATIAISSTELTDTGWVEEGSLSSFPIEILAGTASPTTAESYQYAAYRHQRCLTINPDDLSGITEVGGLQISLTYNTAAVGTPVFPRLVPYSHDPNINVIQTTVDNGDGTQTLTAMITNPNGFVPNADLGGSWAVGKSTFADLQFAVVVQDATSFSGWQSNYWLESADSYFIDTNADVIAGLAPVLGVSF